MASPQSPQRPDVDACLRAAGGPFGEVGHLAPTVRALVAWIRHLEDEAEHLRGAIKEAYFEGYDAGVSTGEDWARRNVEKAKNDGWENSYAKDAAAAPTPTEKEK